MGIDYRRPPPVSLGPGVEISPVPGTMVPRRIVGAESTVAQRVSRPEEQRRGPASHIYNAQQAASVVSFPLANVPQIGVADSVLFLTQPSAQRNMLGFRNASAAGNIYINFGAQADANSWLRLAPNDMLLFDTVVPQDDLYAIADAAGCVLAVSYSTFDPAS